MGHLAFINTATRELKIQIEIQIPGYDIVRQIGSASIYDLSISAASWHDVSGINLSFCGLWEGIKLTVGCCLARDVGSSAARLQYMTFGCGGLEAGGCARPALL